MPRRRVVAEADPLDRALGDVEAWATRVLANPRPRYPAEGWLARTALEHCRRAREHVAKGEAALAVEEATLAVRRAFTIDIQRARLRTYRGKQANASRPADHRAAACVRVAELRADGMLARDAQTRVAADFGVSDRTLRNWMKRETFGK